jgi:predicted metal-binding protein
MEYRGAVMKEKVERIAVDVSEAQLKDDLQRYKAEAIELGATRVEIVRAEDIVVEERVVMKCRVPRCFGYGVCAHCPPHAPKPAEMRDILKEYESAVFFIKDVPSEVIVREEGNIPELIAAYQKIFEIVSKIESMAFYDGHYLALGLAAGSCRHVYCGAQESCRALDGDICRFYFKARPSMEAVGIDVFKMAATAGWDIYPIGSDAKTASLPKGTLAGIVVVR